MADQPPVEESRSNVKQCVATRKDGQRCTAPAMGISPFCFAHDPNMSHKREEARRKGGKHKANVVRLRGLVPPRLEKVYDKLETALADVLDGRLSPKQGAAAASIARAMVAVLQAGETEERLRETERQVRDIVNALGGR